MKSNLDPKLESALCYVPVIGWIAAIIFLIIEKDNDVRFNAVQALVLILVTWVVSFALGLTIVLAILSLPLMLAVFVLQLVLAYKVYQGQKMVLPVIGKWSQDIFAKIMPKK